MLFGRRAMQHRIASAQTHNYGTVKVKAIGSHDINEPKLQQVGHLYCKGSTVMTANTKGQYLNNTRDILSLDISGATTLFI
jgi:hypothetical protein